MPVLANVVNGFVHFVVVVVLVVVSIKAAHVVYIFVLIFRVFLLSMTMWFNY